MMQPPLNWAGAKKNPGAGSAPGRDTASGYYEPLAAARDADTSAKVLLALVPSAVMATRQTTMMSASITAYSTAVGPSSFFRNFSRA